MATAKRTPTTPNITTFGGAGQGRTYTNVDTWESATDNDLVTATAGEILDCFDDEASFDQNFAVAGATTDGDFYRLIRAAAGEGHDGTPLVGVHFLSTVSANVINGFEANLAIQDLILTLSIDSGSNTQTYVSNFGEDQRIIGCLVVDGVNVGSGTVVGIKLDEDSIAVDCLSHNNDLYGFHLVEAASEDIRAYNCVSTDNGSIGFLDGANTPDLINCLSTGNAGDDFSGAWGANTDYNASEDGTATVGANSNADISTTNLYVDSANDDFRLQVIATTDVRNAGLDLSADAFYAFDDDIFAGTAMGGSVAGTLFDTWDIGFHEPEPAATGLDPSLEFKRVIDKHTNVLLRL